MSRNGTVCTAIVLLATVVAWPALAHEAPRLVLDLPPAGVKALRLADEGHPTLEAIRSDPAASDLRIGLAAPDAVRRARALSLDLAAPAGADEDARVSFYALNLKERSEQDYSLHSYDESSGSEVSLVVMGADVLGTIRHDGEVYRVRPLGDGLTAVYRYDTRRLPGCGVTEEFVRTKLRERGEASAAATNQRGHSVDGPYSLAPLSESDSGEVMDVLVAYTPQARRAAGNIDALIRLFVEDTNRFYANSRIRPRIRLAHTYQTEYRQEHDMEIDLDRVTAPNDAYMDEVHGRRDEHGADLVALLVADNTATQCGIAQQYMDIPGPMHGDSASARRTANRAPSRTSSVTTRAPTTIRWPTRIRAFPTAMACATAGAGGGPSWRTGRAATASRKHHTSPTLTYRTGAHPPATKMCVTTHA